MSKLRFVLTVLTIIFVTNSITYASNINSLAGLGDLSFEIKTGQADVNLGEAVFSSTKDYNIMKFSSPYITKEGKSIDSYYGVITNINQEKVKNDYYNVSYLRTGYFKDTTIKSIDIKTIFNTSSNVKEQDYSVLTEKDKNRIIIRIPGATPNKVDYFGVAFGRKGIITLSSEVDEIGINQSFIQFVEMMNRINFIKGEEYQNFNQNENKLAENDLKAFLAEYLNANKSNYSNSTNPATTINQSTEGTENNNLTNIEDIKKFVPPVSKSDIEFLKDNLITAVGTNSNPLPIAPKNNLWILYFGIIALSAGTIKWFYSTVKKGKKEGFKNIVQILMHKFNIKRFLVVFWNSLFEIKQEEIESKKEIENSIIENNESQTNQVEMVLEHNTLNNLNRVDILEEIERIKEKISLLDKLEALEKKINIEK